MSSTSYTSLSDHCNSILSSRSVIHSESLLNMLVDRIDHLEKITNAFITHSSQLHIVACVRTSEQDVWCWWPWLTGTDFRYCVIKGRVISGLWNYMYVFTYFYVFFNFQKYMTFYVFLSWCTRILEHCSPKVGLPTAVLGRGWLNFGADVTAALLVELVPGVKRWENVQAILNAHTACTFTKSHCYLSFNINAQVYTTVQFRQRLAGRLQNSPTRLSRLLWCVVLRDTLAPFPEIPASTRRAKFNQWSPGYTGYTFVQSSINIDFTASTCVCLVVMHFPS